MCYNKERPITPSILAELVANFGQHDASLSDIRTLTICLLGFAEFFRFDEMAKISELDVVVYKNHVEIFVEMDQLRDGAWVVVACTVSPLCPAGMLERYMRMANMSDRPDRPLFRAIVNAKLGIGYN